MVVSQSNTPISCIGELDLPLDVGQTVRAKVNGRTKPGEPLIGTTLVRQWKGTEVRATKVEDGWECDGVVHRSLSAVAKAVTGSHWNGKLFFGLKLGQDIKVRSAVLSDLSSGREARVQADNL